MILTDLEKQQDVFLPPYTVYGLEMDFEANKNGQVPLHTLPSSLPSFTRQLKSFKVPGENNTQYKQEITTTSDLSADQSQSSVWSYLCFDLQV